MAFRKLGVVISNRPSKTYYERWLESEGVPVFEGPAVKDLRELPLRHWKRLGCEGTYLQLSGLDGMTGVYAGKLGAGRSSEPEKHLYEKIIYIVRGDGVAEFQQQGRVPQAFHWQAGSLISPPMNATHRLINHSQEPAYFVAVTTAPLALDHYRNPRFVFNSDFSFSDRYDGEGDYFAPRDHRYLSSGARQWVCETNFIPDLLAAAQSDLEAEALGHQWTQIEMCNNTLVGHLASWPVGQGLHARNDGGGVMLILRSEGYALMWPKDLGAKPYESGHGDCVVRVDWQPGSIFSVPAHYWHQHFNTGREPALQLSLGCASRKYPLGIKVAGAAAKPGLSPHRGDAEGAEESLDRVIRSLYARELRDRGIAPDVDYAVAANCE